MSGTNNSNHNLRETLSSNTLFHFTKSMENLINILTIEFHPRYCFESYSETELEIGYAFPMVCFCDIPLSKTKVHVARYGPYGIGLNKTWGAKNCVCPVHYVIDKTPTLNILAQINTRHIGQLGKYKTTIPKDEMDHQEQMLYLQQYNLMYTKKYKGKMFREETWSEEVRFYDEREWRYVPNPSEVPVLKEMRTPLSFKEFKNKTHIDELDEENAALFTLGFEPLDIRYLLVKTEDEILRMCTQLDKIKAKYSPEEREILKTRIISYERVKEDF